MIRKAPSFFICRCPEILALQEDLEADYIGSSLSPFPAQLSRFVGVDTVFPTNPHSFMFSNPNKYVYESPKCTFQGRLFR